MTVLSSCLSSITPSTYLSHTVGQMNQGVERLERGASASEDAELRKGWIVRSHVDWRVEQNILYKGVENSP